MFQCVFLLAIGSFLIWQACFNWDRFHWLMTQGMQTKDNIFSDKLMCRRFFWIFGASCIFISIGNMVESSKHHRVPLPNFSASQEPWGAYYEPMVVRPQPQTLTPEYESYNGLSDAEKMGARSSVSGTEYYNSDYLNNPYETKLYDRDSKGWWTGASK